MVNEAREPSETSEKVIFLFSGHRIRYLNKIASFFDFRGHRIRYLLIFNENILYSYEITDSESANVLKRDLFIQITEPLSAKLPPPEKINPVRGYYKFWMIEIPIHV
jgi:hypothetical protein